ncbi:MerR family transcriptional regulator [Microbacterium sp. zg.Y1090]|uniref:transcriptional regulator FtsR n=1 Tax=Microbacterium TaxID=33882 RepID=UPI00214C5806|nr:MULTISPECIES: MerR family transcriptional regulator [unclassified Microbacterium]MCR2811413.1 MerR family transcriptional regulator [Microbacterium sp. zg.Y1084]MCR2819169.1 MerR family transcriptional regulator [Microbacterium sp. zg.Y1090]MDL5487832.1 MerR family transcriptional regulator [Microbacterium sp. zg-Y1211]WIM27468.1 MerR family transcriptional regulator [Microbacterium sp. zg-Y1090]
MAQASPRGRSTPAGYLSIGQVLARLAPEFPSLTSSKLRFLEVQGIVTPTRTESGYRKFSPADLERLRLALSLQRDHYMPLQRIREVLDQRDAGQDIGALVPQSITATPRRYRRDELIAAAGAAPALLGDAITAGLLPGADTYDERALTLLRALAGLADHGIQPRHVRSLRQNAERDVALVETALAPLLRRSDTNARARAGELAPELVRRLDELRTAFVLTALERITP